MIEVLTPTIERLAQEFVLVQAWKKTSTYIRYHNWYADTLELDRTAANLPQFIAHLSEKVREPEAWQNIPLRMVPAPKSQAWTVNETGQWVPLDGDKNPSRLRPLAHVDIQDQVIATALLMCIADVVETLQGDPRAANTSNDTQVVSFGNRLFCDAEHGRLRHRWGSSKLYRGYFEDYRTFLARPDSVGRSRDDSALHRVVVVQSDLKQFYDRVRPALLTDKLLAVLPSSTDEGFRALASRALRWSWDPRDRADVAAYGKQGDIEDFDSIALPQGLVAAGFFANLVLLDFDKLLRGIRGREILPSVEVIDCVRYVDDLRLVLFAPRSMGLDELQHDVFLVLERHLSHTAPGLQVSLEKTIASSFRGEERTIVRQSRKMKHIQGAISAGFDAVGGVDILDAVQGLVRSQQRHSRRLAEGSAWSLSPVADVADATVARFAAGRYRRTFRSLRPMIPEVRDSPDESRFQEPDADLALAHRLPSQKDLDEDCRAFALDLIDSWVHDPANVRLLRIGLDLWPAPELLEGVLALLRQYVSSGGGRKAPRRVAWYCLSEILRAGATETGFVQDDEALPKGVNVSEYRARLSDEAARLVSSATGVPWYLQQQAFLFLAVHGPNRVPFVQAGRKRDTRHYRELLQVLRGQPVSAGSADFATNAVLARRCFSASEASLSYIIESLGPRRFEEIASRDPSFAVELLEGRRALADQISPRLREDLCLQDRDDHTSSQTLAKIVFDNRKTNRLRNELTILEFAKLAIGILSDARFFNAAITPNDVHVYFTADEASASTLQINITPSRVNAAGSLYSPPSWCNEHHHWRFQLGYLLRFILTANEDFTKRVARPSSSGARYRPGVSHWIQRQYGLFNGSEAFGDDWLPISEWIEQLLSSLMRWPGQREAALTGVVEAGAKAAVASIEERMLVLKRLRGRASDLLMIPISAPWPVRPTEPRPLRACVVQTVLPSDKEFDPSDLSCSKPAMRKKHRRHLSAALAAVERMLDLRETHKEHQGRLDWLILPELAVHPDDVETHLFPFARAHKTVILAGLTYQQLIAGDPLVNSALWVIPVWNDRNGLQLRIRRQGKKHLAPMEEKLNKPNKLIEGFRPCQWLVGYEWTNGHSTRPLWLTASICYDATDLALAADLRSRSDVFAIPALNIDVNTFDQMSVALHYHMFQMIVVANNGTYGGSNGYAPYKEPFERQIFHMHGQPQASIAFFEIDPISLFQQRLTDSLSKKWKSPPAGF